MSLLASVLCSLRQAFSLQRMDALGVDVAALQARASALAGSTVAVRLRARGKNEDTVELRSTAHVLQLVLPRGGVEPLLPAEIASSA